MRRNERKSRLSATSPEAERRHEWRHSSDANGYPRTNRSAAFASLLDIIIVIVWSSELHREEVEFYFDSIPRRAPTTSIRYSSRIAVLDFTHLDIASVSYEPCCNGCAISAVTCSVVEGDCIYTSRQRFVFELMQDERGFLPRRTLDQFPSFCTVDIFHQLRTEVLHV